MATETELKFRIPAARLAAVRRAVATRTAVVEPLAAVYFDTPDERLAQARIALRLRHEAGGWVQTLKAEGTLALQRLEHNVPLVAAGLGGPGATPTRPRLDLQRHAGSEAGAVLAKVLSRGLGQAPRAAPLPLPAGELLVARYATEVRRTRRVLRFEGARIELALDEGRITAGEADCAVCEIEFELLSGPPQALLHLAARWAARFGLVLDVRSKSERGHRLALGQRSSPPTRARPLRLSRRAAPSTALAAMLGNALGQVLANASPLAELAESAGLPGLAGLAGLTAPSTAARAVEPPSGAAPDPQPDPELLHQLRVGLRRLRTVLQVFAPLLPTSVTDLAPALVDLFAQLGAARDRDAMAESLWPALRAAGAPWVGSPATPALAGPDPLPVLLASPAVQQLWLALLATALAAPLATPLAAESAPTTPADTVGHAAMQAAASAVTATPAATPAKAAAKAPAKAPAEAPASLRKAFSAPLRHLLRQVQRDAARFERLDDAQRHRLRRRIKRLRYATELTLALWPARPAARLLRRLAQVQTPLGNLNDCVVAQAHCRDLASHTPQAWFAVGWLSARRQTLEPACIAALARLAKCKAGKACWPG